MTTERVIEAISVYWKCPTDGCDEEHGHMTESKTVADMLPIRDICRVCGLDQRVEQNGESLVLTGYPETEIHVQELRLVDAGAIEMSDEDIYGFPAPFYPQDVYQEARSGLHRLASMNVEEGLGDLFRRIIFQQYITIVETLLNDVMLMVAQKEDSVVNAIVLRTDLFKDFKLSLKDLAKEPDLMRNRVIASLKRVSWHDFEKAEPIFKAVFGSDLFLDQDVRQRLLDAKEIRHDIVHRNGKTKENKPVEISAADITRLSIDVHVLAEHVCDAFETWNTNHWFKDVPEYAPDEEVNPFAHDGI